MINSKKDILTIILSVFGMYVALIMSSTYSGIFWLVLFIVNIVFYFLDKKCENITLDIISQLYATNKQIDIKELSDKRSCGFTQDDLKFFNYYKRKRLIPFDAELIDPDNYSPDTFK